MASLQEARRVEEVSFLKLPPFLKLTNTDPFAAWFVVTGDATPDGIRVVRSVIGAISSLSIVAFREAQSCVELADSMVSLQEVRRVEEV